MRGLYLSIVLVSWLGLTGCVNQKVVAQKDMEIQMRDQKIAELQQELGRLKQEAGTAHQRADQLNEDLQAALRDLEDKKKLSLDADQGRALITMPNAATFASGSADLTNEGKAIIDKVWEVLIRYPDRRILVEGHTDNVPIGPEYQNRFRTNWELSAARALAVVHYVREKYAADPTRLAAVGCGEYRPVAENTTEQGKASNRRVVIVVAQENV